jgi:hypothetical protein
MALVAANSTGRSRIGEKYAIAVKDTSSYGSIVRETMAAVVYICSYLLRYHDLPVDKSSTQRNKENDKQLS